MNPRAMESVRAILKLCKDHSTQVTISINRMQAEALQESVGSTGLLENI